MYIISTHASLAGRDVVDTPWSVTRQHFYPRVPCGTRPLALVQGLALALISTHASLAGRDNMSALSTGININFYPRVPCGTRLQCGIRVNACSNFYPRVPCGTRQLFVRHTPYQDQFLPTRPLRDATDVPIAAVAYRAHFYPRVPCGTRPLLQAYCKHFFRFLPTRPLRDATTIILHQIQQFRFLPTRPLRDATRACWKWWRVRKFLPTRPLRDATNFSSGTRLIRINFYPRVPCGTRRKHYARYVDAGCISTHASLAGRDVRSLSRLLGGRIFLPTRPLRDATL